MHTKIFEEKWKLLNPFKAETEEQLSAIRNEDPERFLSSVEVCDVLIKQVDALHDTEALTNQQEAELKKILSEITAIRDQITSLIPSLKSKLEQRASAEKRRKVIQQGYGNHGNYVPSIFFDKRK